MTRFRHSRERGNPVKSISSGLPLPDQVEDKLRGSDGLGAFYEIINFRHSIL